MTCFLCHLITMEYTAYFANEPKRNPDYCEVHRFKKQGDGRIVDDVEPVHFSCLEKAERLMNQ